MEFCGRKFGGPAEPGAEFFKTAACWRSYKLSMLEVIQAEHVGVDLGDRVGALRRKDRSAKGWGTKTKPPGCEAGRFASQSASNGTEIW
jgi:hypothetical protein